MCLKTRVFQKRNLREEVIDEIVISSQEYEQGITKLIYYYNFLQMDLQNCSCIFIQQFSKYTILK